MNEPSKTLTYGDLHDAIGTRNPMPILACLECGAEYSANAGDYWDRPKDRPITCGGCGAGLRRFHKVTTLVEC